MSTPPPPLHDADYAWWTNYAFDNVVRRWLQRPERVLARWLRPGDRVLDLGCGMGAFTVAAARLVGPGGVVHAVDLKAGNLGVVARRARRAGVTDRVCLHQGDLARVDLPDGVRFAVASWVLHELPALTAVAARVREVLEPDGLLLVMEPRGHVDGTAFGAIVDAVAGVGLEVTERPSVPLSRAALLRRPRS